MSTDTHPYVGIWVTADGRICHELLPNGRYGESRDGRTRAYQGRYRITGSQINYGDDTGFTADDEFVEVDVLHHAGMVLTRKEEPASASPTTRLADASTRKRG